MFRTITLRKHGALFVLALGVFLAALGGGVVMAASVTPVLFDPWDSGNAGFECAQAGDYTYAHKIDNWSGSTSGSFTASFEDSHSNTITISNNDGVNFDWSASPNPIGAVIVKGGPVANVYYYDPQASSDTGMVSPTNPNNGMPYDVSHATFCWNPEEDMCFEEETGWGEGTRYVKRGNWAMYSTWGEGECIDLIAGQNMIAGEVCFGDDELEINLDPGWYFGYQDENGLSFEETIHIQGYEDIPPKRNPAPGRFEFKFDRQGTESGRLRVGHSRFVGIHVALLHEVACQ